MNIVIKNSNNNILFKKKEKISGLSQKHIVPDWVWTWGIRVSYIRGVSEKYPTCVHISVLVLFFVIRTVASFEVVPIWLNHTLPAVLPHFKAVLKRRF